MWRYVGAAVVAIACIGNGARAFADDSGSLNLPAEISPDMLAKTSARGASATSTADASVEDGSAHASATATAIINEPFNFIGPVNTGSVGDITGLNGGALSQVDTGIGNIQQGVSATAIAF